MLNIIEDVKSWIINEGIWRVIEHVVIAFLLIKVIKSIFVERRGKKGIIDLIVKLGIRFGKKFKIFQNKINDQLSK